MDEGCITIGSGKSRIYLDLGCVVRPEVNGTTGRNTHQIGSQALEQPGHALRYVDEPKAIEDVHAVVVWTRI